MKDTVELSSIEATAYWWTRIIKEKVREIVITGASNVSESKFAEIFYYYTEVEWRKLYLELLKHITVAVNNYVSKGNTLGIDCYSQDTKKNGHNDIKKALSKITGQRVPDIRLANDSYKDSVIYTNVFGASVWYKSCGVTDLPTEYEPSYIITGDEQQLHFSNLLLATIATLKFRDQKFNSVTQLRTIFCNAYITANNLEDNKTEEMFNKTFDLACDRGIILGRSYKETYMCHFRKIDFVNLEQYMEEARYYADNILESASPHMTRVKKPNL